MAHVQARPDRTRLYGLLKGVGVTALAVFAYVVVMKIMGHEMAAEFDKRVSQIAASCEAPAESQPARLQPIGAGTAVEVDPCL